MNFLVIKLWILIYFIYFVVDIYYQNFGRERAGEYDLQLLITIIGWTFWI